ncbi:MAG: hypothetical protein CMD96_06745 [Gammaproteobacteria bacterium]|nr:hypothetical protein [Gammaproteobacteria bacterium]HJP19815.1 hypothetical protein [Nitrospinota bacterium]
MEYSNLSLGPTSLDDKKLQLVMEKFKQFQSELNARAYVCKEVDEMVASISDKCSYSNGVMN